MTISSQIVQDGIAIIILVGGIYAYGKSRAPQQTIKQLEQLSGAYEKRIKALEDDLKDSHRVQLENVAAISDLQGQVKVYKELPLQQLADGIKEVVGISKTNAESNQKILEVLTSGAALAAEDRDVLSGKTVHIKTEVHKEIESA